MELEALKFIGVGLCAIGMLGAAIGVGNIFSSVAEGISRNPSAADEIRKNGILGAALAEFMGLAAFVVMMIIIFVA